MQELVDAISAATGLEPETSRKALGVVLDFLQKSMPPAASAAVIDAIPGGRMAAAGAAEDEAEGSGAARAGLPGLADRLKAEGGGAGHMPVLVRSVVDDLRRRAGEGPAGEAAAALSDLGR